MERDNRKFVKGILQALHESGTVIHYHVMADYLRVCGVEVNPVYCSTFDLIKAGQEWLERTAPKIEPEELKKCDRKAGLRQAAEELDKMATELRLKGFRMDAALLIEAKMRVEELIHQKGPFNEGTLGNSGHQDPKDISRATQRQEAEHSCSPCARGQKCGGCSCGK